MALEKKISKTVQQFHSLHWKRVVPIIQVQTSLRILSGTIVFMPIDNIICYVILFAPKKNISNMSYNNEMLLSLFYCYIGGRVNYASEIWVAAHKGNNVEKLHLEFVNKIMVNGVK